VLCLLFTAAADQQKQQQSRSTMKASLYSAWSLLVTVVLAV
jgi:hypothetical protein